MVKVSGSLCGPGERSPPYVLQIPHATTHSQANGTIGEAARTGWNNYVMEVIDVTGTEKPAALELGLYNGVGTHEELAERGALHYTTQERASPRSHPHPPSHP